MIRGAFAALLVAIAACGTPARPPSEPTRAAVTSSPTPTAAARTVRVALVTDVGGLGDRSFNALANVARLAAEGQLGAATAVYEPRERSEYEPALAKFAQDGFDLVIAVGLGMANPTWRVAKRFPIVRFALVDAAPVDDGGKAEHLSNVSNLVFREPDAGYVVGVIAGEMLRARIGRATTGRACAMGSAPIPAIDRYIAGYQDALERYQIGLAIGYANSFGDDRRAKDLGLGHIAQGCAVLFQVAGGTGYIEAASERGVYAIGAEFDQRFVAPEAMLASAVKRVDRAVLATIQSLREGGFRSGEVVYSADNDAIGYGTLHRDVPPPVKAVADQALADLKAGRVRPRGEIKR